MLNGLIEQMGRSPAPVPWDPDGGNAKSEDCLGAIVIKSALALGILAPDADVTREHFPEGDRMVAAFKLIFPRTAAVDGDRLDSMTRAMIGHNDASARNPQRMSKAWRTVENLVGRERRLELAAA